MRRKTHPLLILALSILILPGIASATDCTVGSCSGDRHIMDLSAATNAHGALKDQGTGYQQLCCDDIANTGSNEVVILQLSGTSNAHACTSLGGSCDAPYTNNIAVYTDDASETDLTCRYASSDGCTGNEICVVALSGQTNAHLADCNQKPSNYGAICCAVTLDTESPLVSDDYLYDGQWNESPQTIDVTVTERPSGQNSGIEEFKYCEGYDCIVDETRGTAKSPESPGIYRFTYSSTTDTWVRYRAWDVAGNSDDDSTGEFHVMIDMDDPVTECGNCPTGQIGNGRDIDLNPTDSDSDIDYTRYCIYEKPGSCDPTGSDGLVYDEQQKIPVGYSCPVPNTCEYVINYYSVDNAGNQEGINSNDIVVNRTLPWCNFEPLTTYTINSQITLNWDGSDPGGDELDKFEIKFKKGDTWSLIDNFNPQTKTTTFDASQYGDGEYEFSCVLYTEPGEQSQPDTTSTTLDTQEPSISFNLRIR